MDSIIRKNTVASRNVIDPIDFAELTGCPMRMAFCKLYFFFKSEMDISPHPKGYPRAQIRHLVPYKGRYYDYIVKKEYNTLEEWAEDNNQNTWDIVYGVNSVHNREPSRRVVEYITLDKLLEFLDPGYKNEVPSLILPTQDTQTVNDILVELSDMSHRISIIASKLQSLI